MCVILLYTFSVEGVFLVYDLLVQRFQNLDSKDLGLKGLSKQEINGNV